MSKPIPYSETLRQFCQMYDAYPTTSDRRFYRRQVLSWSDYNDPNVHYHAEEVDGVAIHIPVHRLEDFISIAVNDRSLKELEIRTNVPAVKKAYEHYQMLLKMCGGDYDAGY